MRIRIPNFLAIMLTAIVLALPYGTVRAGIVTTEEIAAQDAIETQREKVRQFMDRKDVEERLVTMGVAADLARKRADALTHEEVVLIARKLDNLPAGGALRHNETILLLVLIIILILVL